ncbi:uncharacterized protein DFL_005856 [Arthrobotrys flagrans]|uniref:Cryptic loci regulator 2 N-terminal domain-containing protein n=1 Tax=Arthrobotrys flagrans TaxID=97331 RepID=A0A436ZYL5_ARTFL|nr:hypothetical protein DFL_005856 [Arthrobotrys flagrans]
MRLIRWATLLFLCNTWGSLVAIFASGTTVRTETPVETTLRPLPTNIDVKSSLTIALQTSLETSVQTPEPSPNTHSDAAKLSGGVPTKTSPGPSKDFEAQDLEAKDRTDEYTDKRSGRIRPSMFYEKGPFIECATKTYVFNLRPHNLALQPFGIHAFEFPQNDWQSARMIGRRPHIFRYILHRHLQCSNCKCDENGRMVARTGLYPGDDLTTRNCPTQRFADECAVFYDDYQKALDRIPDAYRIGKNYRFDVGRYYGGRSHYMSWRGAERNRAPVPDTKEPYWLEGPDEFQDELSASWLNSGYGSDGIGSSMIKREEEGSEKGDTKETK